MGYELLAASDASTTAITVHGTIQTLNQDIEEKLKKTPSIRDIKVHKTSGKLDEFVAVIVLIVLMSGFIFVIFMY